MLETISKIPRLPAAFTGWHLYPPSHPYDSARTTRLLLLVFNDAGEILALQDKHNVALPQGRVEWDDDTPEDAARREAEEQAGTWLRDVAVAGIAKEPGGLAAMLIMTGRVTALHPRPPGSRARLFVEQKDFHPAKAAAQPAMGQMIAMALAVLEEGDGKRKRRVG